MVTDVNDPEQPGHIFISYCKLDKAFALRLASDLRNAGVRLWMDELDGIVVGMEWRHAIEQAINTCTAMVAVLSPDYTKSEYCIKELARANALKRPIFPLQLRSVDPEQWPLALNGVQYEDFSGWLDRHVYAQKRERLLSRLRLDSANHIGEEPDAEMRYLTNLIAELESRRGVLEYVTLAAEIDDIRPEPPPDDEWGFAELVQSANTWPPREDEKVGLKSIAEAVEKHPRFVLVGDPGSGKTTTIRRLALEAARTRVKDRRSAPLPLLGYLPQWGTESTPIGFLVKMWPFSSDLAGLLKSGEVSLYLDGLNEMGAEGPANARLLKEWVSSPDGPARLIVTCRAGDYAADLKLGSLPRVMTQELEQRQIQQFATNYLKQKAGGFLRHIMPQNKFQHEDVRGLVRLVRNPYMLAALTYLYDKSPDGHLPSNKGLLFQRLVRALWKREQQRGTISEISYKEAEEAFARLALLQIEENKSTSVPILYALEKIGSEQILRVGVSATYVVTMDGQVRFYHQLIQDYFAAAGLMAKNIPAVISRLEEPRFQGTIDSRVASKWDQAVIALCGISEAPEVLIDAVYGVDRELAAMCLLSGAGVGSDARRLLIQKLLEDLHHENGFVRFIAARTLRGFPDPTAVPALTAALGDHWGNPYYDVVSDYAAEALRAIGTEEALNGVANAPRW